MNKLTVHRSYVLRPGRWLAMSADIVVADFPSKEDAEAFCEQVENAEDQPKFWAQEP